MFGLFKREPKVPDKYCDNCGCELATVVYYTSRPWHDIQLTPDIEYNTKTGIGSAPRAEYLICPTFVRKLNEGRNDYNNHYYQKIRDIESQIYPEGCK